jgi:cell division protease FtsH
MEDLQAAGYLPKEILDVAMEALGKRAETSSEQSAPSEPSEPAAPSDGISSFRFERALGSGLGSSLGARYPHLQDRRNQGGRSSSTRLYALPPANVSDAYSRPDPPAIVREAPASSQADLQSYENKQMDYARAALVRSEPSQVFRPTKTNVSYGRFLELLSSFERVKIVTDGSSATGVDSEGNSYTTAPVIDSLGVIEKLSDTGIDIIISPPANSTSVVPFFLGAARTILPPLFLYWLFFVPKGDQAGGMGGLGGGPNPFTMGQSDKKFQLEPDTGVTFADVAGCDEAKAELVEIVDFLKNPEKYSKLGAKIPRGVVLEGPPGTGKTLLAKAVAGEAGVPFVATSGSEFVEMFVGIGASRVRDLFKEAKKNAPCIVFIDEIDAIGRARGGNGGMAGGNQEQENTLNQILTEMDGFDGGEGVIVMSATNRADVLDPALLRPGRFDRRTTVGLPDLNGRIAILKVHARNKPLDEDVDLKSIAKRTMGFSGASLQNLMNEGAIFAARRNAEVITADDIDTAIDRIIVGLEKKGAVQTENTRRTVAYHEAGHALLGALVPDYDLVQKITIIPRSNGAGGLTFFSPSEERLGSGLYTKEYLECQLAVALGGRLAEELMFGESKVTTGASSDIQNVANVARSMVTEWGFSESVGPIAMDTKGGFGGQGPKFAPETLTEIDQEVLRIVNNAYALGRKLMAEHREVLDDIAASLLENEQINGIQFQEILNKYNIVPKAYSELSMEDLQAAGYLPSVRSLLKKAEALEAKAAKAEALLAEEDSSPDPDPSSDGISSFRFERALTQSGLGSSLGARYPHLQDRRNQGGRSPDCMLSLLLTCLTLTVNQIRTTSTQEILDNY